MEKGGPELSCVGHRVAAAQADVARVLEQLRKDLLSPEVPTPQGCRAGMLVCRTRRGEPYGRCGTWLEPGGVERARCFDGDAAACVAGFGFAAMGIRRVQRVGVSDDRLQADCSAVAAPVQRWFRGCTNYSPTSDPGPGDHMAVFLDVCPDWATQKLLLAMWAAGSRVRVHVGYCDPTQSASMTAFQLAAAPYGMLTVDGFLGEGASVSGVTLAHCWAARCCGGATEGDAVMGIRSIHPGVLRDIAVGAACGDGDHPPSYVWYMVEQCRDPTRPWPMSSIMTPSEEEYIQRCAEGERVRAATEAEEAAYAERAAANACKTLVPGQEVFLAQCEDVLKVQGIARRFWLVSEHAALLVVQTSPTTAYIAHRETMEAAMTFAGLLRDRCTGAFSMHFGGSGTLVGIRLYADTLDGLAAAGTGCA